MSAVTRRRNLRRDCTKIVRNDFYLMSRVDADGKTDVTAYPGKSGLVRMTGGRP